MTIGNVIPESSSVLSRILETDCHVWWNRTNVEEASSIAKPRSAAFWFDLPIPYAPDAEWISNGLPSLEWLELRNGGSIEELTAFCSHFPNLREVNVVKIEAEDTSAELIPWISPRLRIFTITLECVHSDPVILGSYIKTNFPNWSIFGISTYMRDQCKKTEQAEEFVRIVCGR